MENAGLMQKAEWGVKRTCLSCGARFYDLKRTPVVCPKCGEELDIAVQQKPKRLKPAAFRKTAAKAVAKKTDDLIDDADSADDVDVDSVSDDAVIETDDDDSDVIVAKGADDDDDSESIEEDVLLDDAGGDDAAGDDEDEDDADEDLCDAKTAKTAKTGGGKPKGS
jgi:uncharacterized protein (TIGR02300 family)